MTTNICLPNSLFISDEQRIKLIYAKINNNNHFMAFNSNQFPVWSTIKTEFKDSRIYYFLPKISCVLVETRRYWDTNSVIVNLYLKFDCKILQFF